MCSCHFYNKDKKCMDRVRGVFSLNTANVGDTFRFEYEYFKRQVIEINFKAKELFAPPIENYNGMDCKGTHIFHFSFKANWGEN